jgi:hypothetical protein
MDANGKIQDIPDAPLVNGKAVLGTHSMPG